VGRIGYGTSPKQAPLAYLREEGSDRADGSTSGVPLINAVVVAVKQLEE
jgi:hypothetical protein